MPSPLKEHQSDNMLKVALESNVSRVSKEYQSTEYEECELDYESAMKAVAVRLDRDTVIKLIEKSTQQVVPLDLVPSGSDYLRKLHEDGLFSSTNLQPLIKILNDIHRSDIVEATNLVALSTGETKQCL